MANRESDVLAQLADLIGNATKLDSQALTESRATTRPQAAAAATGGIGGINVAQFLPTQNGGWLKWLNPIGAAAQTIVNQFRGDDEQAELAKPARIDVTRRTTAAYGMSARDGYATREADFDDRGLSRIAEKTVQQQVVVQVQAMDSRSFLDHRDEIASAVRQALLESHRLGEVIGEQRD